jgi:hypothetical protein
MLTKIVNLNNSGYRIYIGRPSPWGNPWTHKESTIAKFKVNTPEEAVENYSKWLWGIDFTDVLQEKRWWILDHLGDLRNQVLGCYCKPKICHGDILADIVNNWDERVE